MFSPTFVANFLGGSVSNQMKMLLILTILKKTTSDHHHVHLFIIFIFIVLVEKTIDHPKVATIPVKDDTSYRF